MTLLLTLLAVVFTIAAAYQLIRPFMTSRRDQLRFEVLDEDLRRVEELVARKSTLLQELREIKFDHETGKISEADYEEMKQRFERQAVQVMRELDELHGGRGWEDAIDEELERRLDKVFAQREAGAADTAVACHECGKEMEPGARFCSQCGATLEAFDEADESAEPDLSTNRLITSGPEVAQ